MTNKQRRALEALILETKAAGREVDCVAAARSLCKAWELFGFYKDESPAERLARAIRVFTTKGGKELQAALAERPKRLH